MTKTEKADRDRQTDSKRNRTTQRELERDGGTVDRHRHTE